MDSLDLFSIRAMMQALQQIHSIMDIFARPGSLFSTVRGLVPDSRLSIDELDLKTGVVKSVSSEDRFFSKGMKRKIVEPMRSHPVMPAVRAGAQERSGSPTVPRSVKFQQTPHYAETVRPIDIHC